MKEIEKTNTHPVNRDDRFAVDTKLLCTGCKYLWFSTKTCNKHKCKLNTFTEANGHVHVFRTPKCDGVKRKNFPSKRKDGAKS